MWRFACTNGLLQLESRVLAFSTCLLEASKVGRCSLSHTHAHSVTVNVAVASRQPSRTTWSSCTAGVILSAPTAAAGGDAAAAPWQPGVRHPAHALRGGPAARVADRRQLPGVLGRSSLLVPTTSAAYDHVLQRAKIMLLSGPW